MYGYTLILIFLVIVTIILAITIKKHNKDDLDECNKNMKEAVLNRLRISIDKDDNSGPLGGGWFSNWGAIDNAIRKPRHPPRGFVTDPNQVYYTPTTAISTPITTPWSMYVQNSAGTGNPMITSIKKPPMLGIWSQIGTAYTTNPADSEVVYLFQKALDPNRDFYQYKVVNDKGFEIHLDTNITELKNGSEFTVPGWQSKGPFTANITSDGYQFVYV